MWQQIEMYPMATANIFLFKPTVYKSSIAVHESLAAILSQNPKPKLLTNRDLKTIKVSFGLFKMLVHVSTPTEALFIYHEHSEQDETSLQM